MSTGPTVVAEPGLPTRVTIWEMSPRDGLQAENTPLAPAQRIELIRRLDRAGLPVIEAGSFVRGDRVPQMADSDTVLAGLGDVRARTPVLVPNLRGLERAQAAGAEEVAVFLSATESFSQANLSADRATAQARAKEVVDAAKRSSLRVRGYVSMAFGDPWEGPVDADEVARLTAELCAWGVDEVSLGDTIGVATPGLVRQTLAAVAEHGTGLERIALHMHDTYGSALVNIYAALQCGVSVFDSSIGGVGGCPFAQSATGNAATEDLVWMLTGLGIETGIDLPALLDASAWLLAQLNRTPSSRVALATQGLREGA